MLGIDRSSGDQWDAPDATPARTLDAPEPAHAASVGHDIPDRTPRWGTLLTDARTRQDYALAYRAKVDVVYAATAAASDLGSAGEREGPPENPAERRANQPNADKTAGRPSVVDKYPDDYERAKHDPPVIDGPHTSPEKWLHSVNVDAGRSGRSNNCGECTRAVCETWYGKPTAAAAISGPKSSGERISRMEGWADQRVTPATMTAIGQRLQELGPGSSAVVAFFWNTRGGGHWFNAINDGGTIKAVDGQQNRVGSWPPDSREVRYDESKMMASFAIYFDPDGKVQRNDHS